MIPETPNINTFISKDRSAMIPFDKLRAKFSSHSKENIKNLETILKSDIIPFTLKKGFLWKWELTIEIPVIDKFDEVEYQRIIGKLFLLASRAVVDLGNIGLLG